MTGIVAMSRREFEIQLIVAVTAAACALPGVFLVLRRMALMCDAICHSVLFGIVLAFFVTHDLSSPLLVVGAAATGVLTVLLVELLNRTRLVHEDAAIGLVYPALFSIGVILISGALRDVHLDVQCVLLGKPELASIDRLVLMGGILVTNALFIGLFYKELKLATFDSALAATLGFSPWVLHYALTALVSVTAVGAFEVVGSILVVALMIGPPATAYLLTDRLSRMLYLSAAVGVAGGVGGCWLAREIKEVSIAGATATMIGFLFASAFVLAPERGLIALGLRRLRQRWQFAETMLAIHLFNHEGLPEAERESRAENLHEHLRWNISFTAKVVRLAEREGLVVLEEGLLRLTDRGHERAREAIEV